MLLSGGADANQRDSLGDTPLLMACRAGQSDVARALCEGGAIPDASGGLLTGSLTPLHLCSVKGDVSTMRVLLAAGADVELEEGEQGFSPLSVAVQCRMPEAVQTLLAAGVSKRLFIAKANSTHLNPQNQQANPWKSSPSGLTAMHIAGQEGSKDLLEMLLQAKCIGGRPALSAAVPSPLHLACNGGHAAAAEVIIRFDPEAVCARDCNMDTPLHLAVRAGHVETVRVLLSRGTQNQIASKNAKGQTPVDLLVPGSVDEAAFQEHFRPLTN